MNESGQPLGDVSFPMADDAERTCPGQLEVPTPREQKALTAMREIKEQVKPLKERLNAIKHSGGDTEGEALGIRTELERLKQDWDSWEAERKAAAKERMIILGHEEGP
jgi:chromosome segregation ATPase